MNLKQSKLHILSRPEDLSERARTGVSLHCHTEHSKEMLDFVPHYADKLPIINYFWHKEQEKYLAKEGKGIDFSTAYWSPPMSGASVYDIECTQMANAGLEPIVSVTDHDSINACLEVNETRENHRAPISLEWTVPFNYGFFHVGVHNLPRENAVEITETLLNYTFGDDPTDEVGFQAVNEMGGHSIRVGNLEKTAAKYRFSSVSTVVAWLRDRNLSR